MNRTTRLGAVVSTAALLSVSVFAANAAFSDRVGVDENTSAGSVQLAAGDTSSQMTNSNAPLGSSGSITADTTYTNTGTLAGVATFSGSEITDVENGRNSAERAAGDITSVGELSQFASFTVGTYPGACVTDGVVQEDQTVAMADYAGLEFITGPLQPGESVCIVTTFSLDDADNTAQTDSVRYTRNVTLNEVVSGS